ncbi:polysaccharide biosynthesis protein [Mesoterricola sediminis]|uniref:Polysaccharide biosynthesis protein CapD n=1 Tax=Mesoterricola sediminis TaxID=2927980 RepID=A0AA48GMQ2_9BACT|nr:nucleoside-diphosphate sugar epimerase/dehydratase [Mesoterricola sediminis]BDU75926.1 polysaccharide biosynthesis protein CapD [Mesoterricola sediminis]
MERSEKYDTFLQGFGSALPLLRAMAKLAMDGVLAGTAWAIASGLWFQNELRPTNLAVWVVLCCLVNTLFRIGSPLYRLTTIPDVTQVGYAIMTLMGLSFVLKYIPTLNALLGQDHSVAFGASLLTGMFWVTLRIGRRVLFESRARRLIKDTTAGRPLHRTLLVGAGRAGVLVAQELMNHKELGYRVLGFLDDDPEKLGSRINGIRVLGGTPDIPRVTAEFGITHAVLALPAAPGRKIRELIDEFQRQWVVVKTVPGIFNLLGERTWKPDIQEISIEDLLRREPVQLDHTALREALAGKKVLITGAGGSIGGELARQVAALKCGHLMLLGRGENSLWHIQRDMQAHFPEQPFSLELMDIRNRDGLRDIFERNRPDIVIHAAAHKHVPFLETHPVEGVENNIFGTLNVMEAARDFGARKVVNISTDKAVNPTNVLGATKRIAECIVLHVASGAQSGAGFMSVRFGNVLGSRGSVVPIFREQIEHGGPLTVTHEAMTRFFMTIPEASQLVLQAALFGESGKVYVLNMGEPVRIMDLATDMARLSGLTPGRDIQIDVVGLRPGEKIHEELFMDEERSQTHVHPKLMEAKPHPIGDSKLLEGLSHFRQAIKLPHEARQPRIVELLKELVPTYKPSLTGVGRYGGHVRDRRTTPLEVPPDIDRRARHRIEPVPKP